MSKQSKKRYIEEKKNRHDEYMQKKRYLIQMANIKEYNVNKEIMLFDFLLETLKNESRNNVKAIMTKKCVAVNGLVCSQYNYNLYKGDVVMISPKPFVGLENMKKQVNKQQLKLDIIYEDNDFIVINKPSGLLSIESDKEKVDTAYKEVLQYLQSKDKTARCFQVHRIDKNTSGVLLFAKDFKLKEILRKEWNNLVSLREYIALVDGMLEEKEGTIKSYLMKAENTLMFSSKDKRGELAITHYKVMKENPKYSLLLVNIDSGKKNQIRVAMNDMNHPIVGDDKYGEATNPINRLGLHASRLIIKNPKNNKEYEFKAPMPKEFNKVF
ncbi:MAG: RluA family pseudouridine synthase [Bacilli bacterium]|nr:RluA family pseudouridine synthase [Bacilli bacterium]